MREILIQAGNPREAAVLEDGRLVEYLKEDAESERTETVLLGKVTRIMPGMDAAFVDIGQEKNGFLPLKEKSQSFESRKLQCGDRIMVQIKRFAHGQKGAFLSRDITLCGRYLILMPLNRYIGVSAKLDREDHQRLKALGERLSNGEFGIVFRTAAGEAEEEDIAGELTELREQWSDLDHRALTAHAPSVLLESLSVTDELIRDYRDRGIDRIVSDDDSLKAEHFAAASGFMEEAHRQRDKALQRRVWLKSGGNLVIDECEALTVVDVNSAKNTDTKQPDYLALETNLEAAEETARQLRLRNIGGIIIVDMIDMKSEENRRKVLHAMEEALKKDRRKAVVHGFTSLGLLEMTRKRTGVSLREAFAKPDAEAKTESIGPEDNHD